ncbi:MAG: response regulator [Gammaproteobacteria bacterium]|nr:response regulator [Gammaproteobacteria bacterium]
MADSCTIAAPGEAGTGGSGGESPCRRTTCLGNSVLPVHCASGVNECRPQGPRDGTEGERTMGKDDGKARAPGTGPEGGESLPATEASPGTGGTSGDAGAPPGTDAATSSDPDRDAAGRETALVDAILRIGESLRPETVLKEVVAHARALAGAQCGVIVTVDEAGAPRDFVTSGFTEAGRRSMEAWPDAHRVFGHLHGLGAPLRLSDLDAWVRALGCAPFPVPCGAFLATPMRHREAAVGGFFLGGKDGGFTDADEAVLALFAQQAASALANARTHRAERRARAGLEALVETCPVGVAVLDAAGTPLSVNREARRVLAGLGVTEKPPAVLRDTVVCRRGDGHEGRLADLAEAGTVRAEEVEISAPGWAGVRALIDSTPIRSAEGAVERVVVTLQDLAPFEALERSRAEFLGLVSHELRGPLAAIKGAASTALEDPRDPGRAELRQYLRIVEEQAGRMSGLIGDLLDAGLIGAGMLSVDPAPEDLAGLVERARTAFAATGAGHEVTVELPEGLPRVVADARRIAQVLENLLANAARHASETMPIRVAARPDGQVVEVSVSDTGAGIAADRLPHLFRRHAGVGADEASGERAAGTGSGLGLVVCRGLVEAHGGRIRAESAGPGRGARIAFTLPAAGEAGVAPAAAPAAADGAERTPVLVVDNDPHALLRARDALAAAGYAPVTTAVPGEVPRLVETRRPALAVLDLVLPGVDGIELMRTLPALADIPVIFVSAYAGGDTVARALAAGAADYVVKPFSPAELAARADLALRRCGAPRPFRVGELEIDRAKRRVTVAGRPVRLTATEYRLLHALSLDAGGATTYEDLQRRAWGPGKGDPQAVRSAVTKLRRKLGDDARNPRYVIGERGLGYRMPEPDEA